MSTNPIVRICNPDHLGSSSYITNLAGTVSQHMEYLPFGETLADEHLNSRNSPFKYNGKEFDEETGNYYYGARYYDPKWSIWLSVDPLAEKYPNISSYAYVANNPINAIDPDGKEIIFITGGNNGKPVRNFRYSKGNFYDIQTGKRYNPEKESVSKTLYKLLTAYRKIENSNDKVLKRQLHTLEEDKKNKHQIYETDEPGRNSVTGNGLGDSQTWFNLSQEEKTRLQEAKGGIPETDLTIIVHEMGHQYDEQTKNLEDHNNSKHKRTAKDPAEIRAVFNENKAREIECLPKRTTYGGEKIDKNQLDNPPNYEH